MPLPALQLALDALLACFLIALAAALAERWMRRAEPSGEEARRAAERYRGAFGDDAQAVVREHIYGARLSGDARHRRLLLMAAAILRAQDGGDAALLSPFSKGRRSPRRSSARRD